MNNNHSTLKIMARLTIFVFHKVILNFDLNAIFNLLAIFSFLMEITSYFFYSNIADGKLLFLVKNLNIHKKYTKTVYKVL